MSENFEITVKKEDWWYNGETDSEWDEKHQPGGLLGPAWARSNIPIKIKWIGEGAAPAEIKLSFAADDEGHVTSGPTKVADGEWTALAFYQNYGGPARLGATVTVKPWDVSPAYSKCKAGEVSTISYTVLPGGTTGVTVSGAPQNDWITLDGMTATVSATAGERSGSIVWTGSDGATRSSSIVQVVENFVEVTKNWTTKETIIKDVTLVKPLGSLAWSAEGIISFEYTYIQGTRTTLHTRTDLVSDFDGSTKKEGTETTTETEVWETTKRTRKGTFIATPNKTGAVRTYALASPVGISSVIATVSQDFYVYTKKGGGGSSGGNSSGGGGSSGGGSSGGGVISVGKKKQFVGRRFGRRWLGRRWLGRRLGRFARQWRARRQ